MAHETSHPFPYFEILVTRQTAVIEQAIKRKYDATKPNENSNVSALRKQYSDFCDNAAMIAEFAKFETGAYQVDLSKVDKIIKQHLPRMRKIIENMVDPIGKIIHPDQVDMLKNETARDSFNIAIDVAGPYVDQVLKEIQAKISTEEKPKILPKPVEDLKAKAGSGEITLSWILPGGLSEIQITRTSLGQKTSPLVVKIPGTTLWVDNGVTAGEKYEYQVQPVVGGSVSVAARRVVANSRDRIRELKLVSQLSPPAVKLSWSPLPNTTKLLLFRSEHPIGEIVDDQGQLQVPAKLGSPSVLQAVNQYEDTRVRRGDTYYYSIVACHSNGMHSPSSCEVVKLDEDPAPPAKIKVTKVAGHIYLSWEAATGYGKPGYHLVRSLTADPTQAASKAKAMNLSLNSYDDTDLVPGCSYYYHLQVKAGELLGTQCKTVGPVLALAEVGKLQAEAASGQVRLKWTSPPNVKRIEVRRGLDRAPSAPDDTNATQRDRGTLLPLPHGDSLIDVGLTNGRTYGYRVSCVFVDCNGREETSLGEAVAATPFELPALVTGLAGTLKNRNFLISWENQQQADVTVFRSPGRSPCLIGDAISLADLPKFGTALSQVGKTEAVDPSPLASAPFYHVFSINSVMAVYCGSGHFVQATDFKVWHDAGNIRVAWRWPSRCIEAQLSCGDCDTQEILHAERTRRTSKNKDHAMAIRVTGSGKYVVKLKCFAPSDESLAVEGPPLTEYVDVRFSVHVGWRFKRLPGGRILRTAPRLEIHFNGDPAAVRELRLVGLINDHPRDISSGRCLAHWKGTPSPKNGVLVLAVDKWPNAQGDVMCRLFALPKEGVEIASPPLDQCVL